MLFNQPKPHWKGFTKYRTTNWQTFYRHRDSAKRIFKPKRGQFRDHNHCLQPNNSIRLMDHFSLESHHSQLKILVKEILGPMDHFQQQFPHIQFRDLVKETFKLMDHFQREFHQSQLNNLVKRIFRAIDHFRHHCRTQFQIILIAVHMFHQLKVLQAILAHIYRHEATYLHKKMISHFNKWNTLFSFSKIYKNKECLDTW